jgi:hypothetical protein
MLARTGNNSQELVVNFAVTGTARYVTDYFMFPADVGFSTDTARFLPGSSFTFVSVYATKDSLQDGDRSLTLSLLPSANYLRAIPFSSTLTLRDIDLPLSGSSVVSLLTGAPTGFTTGARMASLEFRREGDSSAGLEVHYQVLSGAAGYGELSPPLLGTVTIEPGALAAFVQLTPMINPAVPKDRKVVVELTSGPGYSVAERFVPPPEANVNPCDPNSYYCPDPTDDRVRSTLRFIDDSTPTTCYDPTDDPEPADLPVELGLPEALPMPAPVVYPLATNEDLHQVVPIDELKISVVMTGTDRGPATVIVAERSFACASPSCSDFALRQNPAPQYTLSFTKPDECTFAGWTDAANNTQIGSDATLTITFEASRAIGATFNCQ